MHRDDEQPARPETLGFEPPPADPSRPETPDGGVGSNPKDWPAWTDNFYWVPTDPDA